MLFEVAPARAEQEALSKLRLLRILRRWTQDDLVKEVRATGARTDRGEVSRLERGILPMSGAKRAAFAMALGVDEKELE